MSGARFAWPNGPRLSGARPAPRVFPASRAQASILIGDPFTERCHAPALRPAVHRLRRQRPGRYPDPRDALPERRRHAHGRLFRLRRQQAGDPPWGHRGPRMVGAQRLCQTPRPRPRRTRLQRPGHRHVRRRQAHRAPAGRDGLHAGRDPGCRRRQGALPRRPGTAEAATADRSQPDRRGRLLLRRQDRPRHGPPGPAAGRRGELPRRPRHRHPGQQGQRQGQDPRWSTAAPTAWSRPRTSTP